MRAVGRYKKILRNVIDNICSERDKYFVSPDSDFTRSGMIAPQDIFTSLLLMEDRSLSGEVIEYFGSKKDIPTSSAFVQARAKIKPEAFKAFFDGFISETADNRKKYLYKGYRLFAVDGSDSHVPDNPDDPDSYFSNSNGSRYNLYHINAMYDLLRHTYTDVVIQKKRTVNEVAAFIEMVEKHKNDDIPIIFTADRGYECYNDMAHIIESGHKFVIRVKDIDSRGIAAGLGLPDRYFDEYITLYLTRSYTEEIKKLMKYDCCIKHIVTDFDYLPKDYDRNSPAQFYELPIRIVRFKVKDSYEVTMTNLPKEEFPPVEIKKLYSMRWGIETSFRHLKYTIGLNYYHSKKPDSLLQEIYSRMVLYNFCQLITNRAKVKPSKKGRKYAYKINFTQAVKICRDYLKKKIREENVIKDIEKFIESVRTGRSSRRIKSPKRDVYFNYRIA